MEQAKPELDTVAANELTLKHLIIKIREWIQYLLKKWLIIGLCGLVGGALGFFYAINKKVNYEGQLTFVLEEGKKGGLSSYAGIASQFGIDLGGGGDVGVFSGDNIIEFLKSRMMLEKTLLSPTMVDGKSISLAEFYIDNYKLRKTWQNDTSLANLHLPYDRERGSFSRKQDSILFTIYKSIIENNLVVSKPDKKLSFISVKCTAVNEQFVKELIEKLVKVATEFYVDTKLKRSSNNVNVLQRKADSIETLLNRKTYSAAAAEDLNQNPVRNVARIGYEVASRDKMMLQTIYGEVIKNLELSKLSMAQETPVIEIVDHPIYPLKIIKFGRLKGLILGGFLFGFLAIMGLLVRRMYSEVMK